MNNIIVPAPTSEWTDTEWNKFRDWLRGILKISEMTITFTKKDGTERVMHCTLNPDQLPPAPVTETKKERKVNDDVMAVYDIEEKGWRSFTLKSVTRVQLTI